MPAVLSESRRGATSIAISVSHPLPPQMWLQMWLQMRSQMWLQVWLQMWLQMRLQVWLQMWLQMRLQMRLQMWLQMRLRRSRSRTPFRRISSARDGGPAAASDSKRSHVRFSSSSSFGTNSEAAAEECPPPC